MRRLRRSVLMLRSRAYTSSLLHSDQPGSRQHGRRSAESERYRLCARVRNDERPIPSRILQKNMRPRAGHAWSAMRIGPKQRTVWIMTNDDGKWITTGHARGWPRCTRCRKPIEASPFNSGLCPICYFYKRISVDEFWRLHKTGYYLAPYNIGKRCQREHPKTLHEARP